MRVKAKRMTKRVKVKSRQTFPTSMLRDGTFGIIRRVMYNYNPSLMYKEKEPNVDDIPFVVVSGNLVYFDGGYDPVSYYLDAKEVGKVDYPIDSYTKIVFMATNRVCRSFECLDYFYKQQNSYSHENDIWRADTGVNK